MTSKRHEPFGAHARLRSTLRECVVRLEFFCYIYVYSSVGDTEVSVIPWAFFFYICAALAIFKLF